MRYRPNTNESLTRIDAWYKQSIVRHTVTLGALALLACAPMLKAETTPMNAHANSLELFRKRMGIFIHWTPPGKGQGNPVTYADGVPWVGLDEFCDKVDVPTVCRDIAELGFEYVMLTDFHGNGTLLHPSWASDRWRGEGYAAKRDLVGEMIAELKKHNIGMILFTHPIVGHNFPMEQQEKTGWNDPAFNYWKWNEFVNHAYLDISQRYGDDMLCMGFDSTFGYAGDIFMGKLDTLRLQKTIRTAKPGLPLMALAGPNEVCELGLREVWRPGDHPSMKRPDDNDNYDITTWPAYRAVIGLVQGYHWATIPVPEDWDKPTRARMTAEQMFQYVSLMAGASSEGPGVAFATSPYANGTWETGVREEFVKLKAYMDPVRESMRDVFCSSSYPTPEGATIAALSHGIVGTRSIDDRIEYIHVLRPPEGKTLSLPQPADGKRFTGAALLANDTAVGLTQNTHGVQLTLDDGQTWDPINTVIRLGVDPASIPPNNLALHCMVFYSTQLQQERPWPPGRLDWNPVRLVDRQTTVTPKPEGWSAGNAGWSSARASNQRSEHVGVDLAEAFDVARVRLHPRDDAPNAGQGFPLDFVIQVSADSKAWTTVAEHTDYPLPTGVQEFTFAPRKARHVRVLATRLRPNPYDHGMRTFQLAELEVLAR